MTSAQFYVLAGTAPKVSVVMVVCNVERFLGEAVESILAQTMVNFEFIIVDFGSSDGTKTIIKNYAAKDARIKFHEIAPCSLTEARNHACSLAQAEYIAIMDADDIAMPERLHRQIDFIEQNPELGLLGSATQWIDAKGNLLWVDHLPAEDHEIRLALQSRCSFCQPTVLMRKEAFLRTGGYRAIFAQAEDYDLWMRIAEHYQCANLKEPVLKYRIHPYQVSIRKRKQQTLCVLAAQISAEARKKGISDPLNGVHEITGESLSQIGVSESAQQTAIVGEYLFWLRTMYAAGEHKTALQAVTEILASSDVAFAEKWQIANLWMLKARLDWKQKQFGKSFIAGISALITRPVMLGRPVKMLWRWLSSRMGNIGTGREVIQ